jgi:hypothetical protein
VFLDVGQIINGYTLEGALSAAGTITSSQGVVPGVPDSSIGEGAAGQELSHAPRPPDEIWAPRTARSRA